MCSTLLIPKISHAPHRLVYYIPYYLSSSSSKSLSFVIHSPRLLHGSRSQKQEKGLDGPVQGPADPIYLSEMRSIGLHRQPSGSALTASDQPERRICKTSSPSACCKGGADALDWRRGTALTLASHLCHPQRHLALASSSRPLVFRATGPFFSSRPEPISTPARLHVQRRDALSQSPPGATRRSKQAARA